MNITKDSEKVICYIYKMYLERRKMVNQRLNHVVLKLTFIKAIKTYQNGMTATFQIAYWNSQEMDTSKFTLAEILIFSIIPLCIWKTDLKTVFPMYLTLFQNLSLDLIT